ncbi:MAG: DNA repair protein RecO (recombination protein O) [Saprospiraceae bacterium]|jgi:DNA repair protein RecO (recombination protein O)
MLIKTRGIIFRAVKYSESSIITDIFTEEKGLRSYIISGVRKKNAIIKASILQVMTLVDMVVYHREDRNLTRIKEIKPAYVYHAVPFDILKGAVGLFMVELARKTIQESERNDLLFNFLFGSFQQLDTTEHPVSNFHIAFMVELTAFLGFLPGGEYSKKTPGFDLAEGVFSLPVEEGHHSLDESQSKLLDTFLKTPMGQSYTIKLNRAERKAFLNQLIIFYKFHVENFDSLNSQRILEEVME